MKKVRCKKLTLAEISVQLEKHRISLKKQKSRQFDLLCNIDGRLTRMSFSEGRYRSPLGIFPFKDNNTYFELDEIPAALRQDAENSRLPEHDWCQKVYPLKKRLNKCLEILAKPPLEGCYFARHYYMSDCNWIVGFADSRYGMQSDFYEGKKRSKIRYAGRFPE